MSLTGRVILAVEDECFIAVDLKETLEEAGARVIVTSTVERALATVERALAALREPRLSAAIVDHVLGEEDASDVCGRLKQMGLPFITYSGFEKLDGDCADAPLHLSKPARPGVLITAVKGLIGGRPSSELAT